MGSREREKNKRRDGSIHEGYYRIEGYGTDPSIEEINSNGRGSKSPFLSGGSEEEMLENLRRLDALSKLLDGIDK